MVGTAALGPRAALLAGPLLALGAGAGVWLGGIGTDAAITAAVTALCATWWILEPIHIAATSLIPFAAFPLTGVMAHGEVARSYGHTMILLLLGGFMLSGAIEKSGAHRRLAFAMVSFTGGGDRRLVLGFMIAAAVCSMWISNTATTLMLLPVALATLADRGGAARSLEVPLLLGIAYAASIGGLATPIGTPPNVIFMGIYTAQTGNEVTFLSWMQIGVPVTAVMVPIAWLWLTRKLEKGGAEPRAVVLETLPAMGSAERRVLAIFALTAAAWIFRTAPGGGWAGLLGVETTGDATVALAAVVAMCLIPDGEGGRVLDWETASKIPWGLLILFGGGIAIAEAFSSSGLSAAIGDGLSALASWPTLAMIAVICLAVTFMTEVTSNTATATLLMPVLAAAGVAAAIDPAMLMVPAALSASCAFMLPVATAPNAIMFGTGRVSTARMAREGLTLNFLGAAVITIACAILVPYL
jgi:sodium-dependent dicarboxylate transporter 2/3/5